MKGNEEIIAKHHDEKEMYLGLLEFWAMNNPVRRLSQKFLEFPLFRSSLKRRKIDLRNKIIMDAGCGSGYGSYLINKQFSPSELISFDLMSEQIKRAEKKYPDLEFKIGNMLNLDQTDQSVDAVFMCGILHHIPQWKQAVKEVYRILKPGGVFLFEEPRYQFTFKELEAGTENVGFIRLEKRAWIPFYAYSYLWLRPKLQ
jgi:ubiquinone/menaquinone biosynthesis C-methylase UbiE